MSTTDQSGARTTYIPYMADHCYVLAAAFEAVGVRAEVLPPPDRESLAIGLEHCKGRECLPCFTTTGDFVKLAQRPGFEANRSTMFFPKCGGSCRIGQYTVLQRDILERLGFRGLEFMTPTSDDGWRAFGEHPLRMRSLVWQGAVATDLLQKLLHEHRPYELTPGEADRRYQLCLAQIVEAVRQGAGRHLRRALRVAAAQFASLPVDRRERRPIIAVNGEMYVRYNPFANGQIIRLVEAAGGEALLEGMSDFLYQTNGWQYRQYNGPFWTKRDFVYSALSEAYLRFEEWRLVRQVAHLLTFPHETPVELLFKKLTPHFSPALNSEAILTMSKAFESHAHGLSGIINIMPFTCMPGLITAGMAPQLRENLDGIPWLDVICDGQETTNTRTRLEPFLYQARQYQRRHQLAPAHA